jgi:hypothetical protein
MNRLKVLTNFGVSVLSFKEVENFGQWGFHEGGWTPHNAK